MFPKSQRNRQSTTSLSSFSDEIQFHNGKLDKFKAEILRETGIWQYLAGGKLWLPNQK
jgi:hypothetical protein